MQFSVKCPVCERERVTASVEVRMEGHRIVEITNCDRDHFITGADEVEVLHRGYTQAAEIVEFAVRQLLQSATRL